MFYVIGDYGDSYLSILNEYRSLSFCRGAINWQGGGNASVTWHNSERATVVTFGSKAYETTFYICKPTIVRGEFKTVQNNNTIRVTGTALVEEAHNRQLDKAVQSLT